MGTRATLNTKGGKRILKSKSTEAFENRNRKGNRPQDLSPSKKMKTLFQRYSLFARYSEECYWTGTGASDGQRINETKRLALRLRDKREGLVFTATLF